jgi:hypothetical protein
MNAPNSRVQGLVKASYLLIPQAIGLHHRQLKSSSLDRVPLL